MYNPQTSSINHWDVEDRPREKMASSGAEKLKNEELLAILIGSGSRNKSAVQLMKDILNDNNNDLGTLGKNSIEDLCRYKGIGEAKAISILAACELGRRRENETIKPKEKYNDPEKIWHYFRPKLQDCNIEEVWIMLLRQNLTLINSKKVGSGGITGAPVDIRVILREALNTQATQIVLCHNHPSGSCKPSIADDKITDKLAKSAKLIDLHLIDHLIFAEGDYYSYAKEGRL